MSSIETIFNAILLMIETQYPHLGFYRRTPTRNGNDRNYLAIILNDGMSFLDIIFEEECILIDHWSDINALRIEYVNPSLLGKICSRIYDCYGIRPIDPTFTVGL